MDETFLAKAWAGLLSVLIAVLIFAMNRNAKKQDDLRADIDNTARELLEHRLHVSETYASKGETQASLGRIHDRIDDVSSDIKTILREVKK